MPGHGERGRRSDGGEDPRRIYGRKPGHGDAGQSSGRGDQSPKVTASSQGEATSPYGAAGRYCEPPPVPYAGRSSAKSGYIAKLFFGVSLRFENRPVFGFTIIIEFTSKSEMIRGYCFAFSVLFAEIREACARAQVRAGVKLYYNTRARNMYYISKWESCSFCSGDV